jgi:hypothetical protein
MAEQKTHHWVTLRDAAGKDFMKVRIPKQDPPLPAIQWSARIYVIGARADRYEEIFCLFLTLDSQFPQTWEEKRRALTEPFAW